jgi:S-adenosylhomocysteine hydrolase
MFYERLDWVSDLAAALREFHDAGSADNQFANFAMELTRRMRSGANNSLHDSLTVAFADLACTDAIDGTGTLNAVEFARRWGPAASTWLERSLDGSRCITVRPRDGANENQLVDAVAETAPQRLVELLDQTRVPNTLPLLDHLETSLGVLPTDIDGLVAVQHLLGSTVPLLRLLSRRMDPANVSVLGKPYSTNPQVVHALRAQYGNEALIEGGDFSNHFRDFESQFDEQCERVLLGVTRRMASGSMAPDHRVLVLDDGAHLTRMLHDARFADVAHRFVCVEQTSRGIWKLADVDLRTPVVNVAESWVKLRHESPLIAESVRDCLLELLAGLDETGVKIERRALVIGFGTIGNAVACALAKLGWDVQVYDKREAARRSARDHGFPCGTDLHRQLPEVGLVVGCTGMRALSYQDMFLLSDSTVVVSASSSDIEFGGWELRRHASLFPSDTARTGTPDLLYDRLQGHEVYMGHAAHPATGLCALRLAGKVILLANGGFPINLNGEIDPIAPGSIQLTRALLYAGALQAAASDGPGLHTLNERAQQTIWQGFQQCRKDTGSERQ